MSHIHKVKGENVYSEVLPHIDPIDLPNCFARLEPAKKGKHGGKLGASELHRWELGEL